MNTATASLPQLDAKAYHALDAVSASRLSDLHRSSAYCRWRIDHPDREDTDATRIGDATHAAVLTPDIFRARYLCLPDDAPRRPTEAQRNAKKPSPETVAAVAWWTEWNAKAGDRPVLSRDDFDLCLRLRDAVWQNEEARALFESCTAFEQSVLWTDPGTGLKCKARFDALGPITLPDLKTSRSAQPSGFVRSVVQYGYHRQAAWYLRAAEAVGLTAQDFAFVVVEKAAPFQVAVYRLDQAALDTGAAECVDLLTEYAACVREKHWPGYVGGTLSLPAWYGRTDSQPADEAGDLEDVTL